MLVPFVNEGVVGIGKNTGCGAGGIDRVPQNMRHEDGFVHLFGAQASHIAGVCLGSGPPDSCAHGCFLDGYRHGYHGKAAAFLPLLKIFRGNGGG